VKNFALTGVAGYVAPRHLRAIRDTGNRLVAAMDPHDSAGVLDQFFPDASFFTEFERFDRHLEKLRRGSEDGRVHYLSICSPNHLHDAHIRLALRLGAHAVCEKPLVLNPWNLDALEELERESDGTISCVLQLRLHPALLEVERRLRREARSRKHEVDLTYVTARGLWYRYSWKGSPERSGGIATNVGIHFFDALIWLFGAVQRSEVHLATPTRGAGALELARARVRWFLSTEAADLTRAGAAGATGYRAIRLDGEEVELSKGLEGLHTRVYEEVLVGRGFGIAAVRPAIELAHDIRSAAPCEPSQAPHPLVEALRAGGG
jgi:UDP-N-acetyl-2-amino-2-deoxyglucuronate dehydrogenase